MKIANAFTRSKALITKVLTAGLLAGAVVIAAPSKADAQVSFGVRFGGPVYHRPVYVAPAYGYYGPAYYGSRVYGRFGWRDHERFAYRRY